MKNKTPRIIAAGLTAAVLAGYGGHASSHREAPAITTTPKLDCTDFYAFNSYETGRSNYVTLVANYIPLQDAYGGPNYFTLTPSGEGVYEIHVDNTGDSKEDLTFRFKFKTTARNIALAIGPEGNRKTNSVPVINVGQITAANRDALNVDETYTIEMITGSRRTGTVAVIADATTGSTTFSKPVDNVGNKSIPDYESYASAHIHEIKLPGDLKGKVFVGQRKDPFVVNLGETFDLVNYANPLGPVDGEKDSLAYKNVTSIILELPKSLLVKSNPVIATWTTASKVGKDASGAETLTQVSRLGHPLVNEVVIGLKDKDLFNASEPKDDPQFLDYVTHPTLPAIIELLFGAAGVKAPNLFPRTDLVAVFLTGVDGLNKDGSVGEMLRLNTSIAAVPADQQKNLGVLAGDVAGFPNGRRLGDDVVDMALRVVMGVLLPATNAPAGQLPFTDGAMVNASMFSDRFPYLRPPLAGSPNDRYINVVLHSASKVEGPYAPVKGSFDPASEQISTSATTPNGFYRMEADGRIQFRGVQFKDGTVKLGISN